MMPTRQAIDDPIRAISTHKVVKSAAADAARINSSISNSDISTGTNSGADRKNDASFPRHFWGKIAAYGHSIGAEGKFADASRAVIMHQFGDGFLSGVALALPSNLGRDFQLMSSLTILKPTAIFVALEIGFSAIAYIYHLYQLHRLSNLKLQAHSQDAIWKAARTRFKESCIADILVIGALLGAVSWIMFMGSGSMVLNLFVSCTYRLFTKFLEGYECDAWGVLKSEIKDSEIKKRRKGLENFFNGAEKIFNKFFASLGGIIFYAEAMALNHICPSFIFAANTIGIAIGLICKSIAKWDFWKATEKNPDAVVSDCIAGASPQD